MGRVFGGLLPLLFLTTLTYASEWRPYLSWDTLAYSESVPLAELINHWEGENRGGDTALIQNRAEIGVHNAEWQIGLLHRYDYYLSFTPESAEFYYQKQNGLLDDPARVYQLDLEGFHFEATGLMAAYTIPLAEGVKMGLRGEYLEGHNFRITDLHATGNLAVLENWRSIQDLRFRQEYRGHDALLERLGVPERSSADGKGGTFSVDFELEQGPWHGKFALDDLVGIIRWNRAVVTTLHMEQGGHNTWFPVFPDNGRIMEISQQLPLQIRGEVDYQVAPQWSAHGRWRSIRDHDFYQIGLSWKPRTWFETGLMVEPVVGAVGVEVEMPWTTVALTSDATQLSNARYLSVGVRLNVDW
ncbi:MAG: hypothetical protein HOL04_01040 [Gammaproteobacteria bacterium]|jgi:hypothetical protein|nr:hypothetical protein [Gammaproteobacteria bacterium]MBT4606521.1 hypothetical protein [Thiotrichales bacterium]MBT7830328.1 hypothetical protein [Candidatus Neomarinimicrobiota bacterium]MBT3844800.1 hypothetical protein [Gammaproteobacteria bacterium]MBT4081980.1 hypothetical protein [Gammaproteobacteria bacterium]